jgi:UDPglucose 6-dehydrogenase
MKMVVIGLGYLGATHAVAMTEIGHEVIGIDVDKSKVEKLSKGELPFYEPGLDEALEVSLASGRLSFTTEFNEKVKDAELFWICVGTPQKENSLAADTSYVKDSVESIVKHVSWDAVIAGKSTVPVGTHKELLEIIKSNKNKNADIRLVWNPEFLREGTALQDSLKPDRIVIGLEEGDDYSREVMRKAYESILDEGVPFVIADMPTAELVKVAANSFLATKISFINAMAEISETSGADVVKLSEAIGYDERIGNKFLKSGIGFGGGCLPKDIRAFISRAEELGAGEAVEFLENVDSINLRRRQRAVELATEALGGDLRGKRITVLGAAFKPDSDDIRDAPSLSIALMLHDLGANVTIHDPEALNNVRLHYQYLKTEEDLHKAFINAELVMHLTEWKEYRNLNPLDVLNVVTNPVIIDGRNALDVRLWKNAGWKILALGRNL